MVVLTGADRRRHRYGWRNQSCGPRSGRDIELATRPWPRRPIRFVRDKFPL